MSTTTKCFLLGIEAGQNLGFSELGGSFPMPETETGSFILFDNNNIPHVMVIDNTDKTIYDISTRDGPSGTYLKKVYKDKLLVDDTGGVEITPEVTFKEDKGEFEKYVIENLSNRFYVRSNSLDEKEFEVIMYVDGNNVSETYNIKDVNSTNEILFDRKIEGFRLQSQFKSTSSNFCLIGKHQDYIVKDINYNPTSRISTESDHQYILSNKSSWITRPDYTVDRCTDLEVTISGSTLKTIGPDNNSNSAIRPFSLHFDTSISAEYSISLWTRYGSTSVTIDESVVPLNIYSGYGDWNLCWVSGIITPGNVTITISGDYESKRLFDICVYNEVLTEATLRYYFKDVTENSGNNVCPWY